MKGITLLRFWTLSKIPCSQGETPSRSHSTREMESFELRLASCTIRQWRWSDKPSLVRHANNRNVVRMLRDRFPHPYTEADANAWLSKVVWQQPPISFAIDVGGEAVGGIGIIPQSDVHRLSAEIGFWLGEDYWGKGITTEAVKALSEYAMHEFHLCRLYAQVFSPNRASARVLEKAGYMLEGILKKAVVKDGEMLDLIVYAYVK